MQLTSALFDRLEVKPPYFALDQLQMMDEKTIEAHVPIEQLVNEESSLISGAEVGRHLAILGSCVLSTLVSQAQAHFFLADRADFQLVQYRKKTSAAWPYLIGRASAQVINRRSGEASTWLLTPAGEVLYKLIVHYNILAKVVFERLFAKNACHEPLRISQQECDTNHRNPFYFVNAYNPYQKLPALFNQRIRNNRLTCTLGKILPEKCLGHFPGFPAMPVAILMSALIKASGDLLKKIVKQNHLTYYVEKALVQVDNLAFAGDVVNLESTFVARHGEAFEFNCRAENAAGKKIGELVIFLKR